MTPAEMYNIFVEEDKNMGRSQQNNILEIKPHQRRDIAGLLLLHQLNPQDRDIISDAEHDKIWLSVDEKKVAEVITREQIRILICCGILFDPELGSFYKYV